MTTDNDWCPHAIVFDKEFLSGNLKGITITNQRITYPNRKAAEFSLTLFSDEPIRDLFTKAKFIMKNKLVEAI